MGTKIVTILKLEKLLVWKKPQIGFFFKYGFKEFIYKWDGDIKNFQKIKAITSNFPLICFWTLLFNYFRSIFDTIQYVLGNIAFF